MCFYYESNTFISNTRILTYLRLYLFIYLQSYLSDNIIKFSKKQIIKKYAAADCYLNCKTKCGQRSHLNVTQSTSSSILRTCTATVDASVHDIDKFIERICQAMCIDIVTNN